MTDYWKSIERRLHEESGLHHPRNQVKLILQAYIDGTLNKYDEDDLTLFHQSFLLTAEGIYLDEKGAEMGIPRYPGKVATGTVTFSLPEEATSTIAIPKDTIISDYITGFEYVTTNDTKILAGELDITVNVHAISYGSKYNVPVDELTIIETDKLPTTLTVTNEIAITGGVDGESDDEYRQRLFNSINTRLSVNFLKKQGIIMYAKEKYDDPVRTKMTSLNPYMNNQYCAIPPSDTVMKFLLKEVIYFKIMEIYIKGWK